MEAVGGGRRLHAAAGLRLSCPCPTSSAPTAVACPANDPALQAGLLLALFGGVRKAPGGEGEMALRGDVHVLLVGDPGLGKSQLLQVGPPQRVLRAVHGHGAQGGWRLACMRRWAPACRGEECEPLVWHH